MRTLADIRRQASPRWDRHWSDWAQEAAGIGPVASGATWPVILSLDAPTEQAALADVGATQAWVRSWLAYTGPGQVRVAQRTWRSLGPQQVPTHLALGSPPEVAALVRQGPQWESVVGRLGDLTGEWTVAPLDRRTVGQVCALAEVEWGRVRAFLRWVAVHPTSGLLPRQLPIPGVDSKWFEAHRSLCGALRRATTGIADDGFGLRALGRGVTVRVLDPALRAVVGGLESFAAPVEDLAGLPWRPQTAIICENLQSAFSFRDRCGTVVLAKQGYAVDVFEHLPWLRTARVLYWGDLDTHGLAILNRLRSHVPDVESVLMDEPTLLAHRELWSHEPTPTRVPLALLTEAEQAVYAALRDGVHGQGVRLEQERIPWSCVTAAFAEVSARPVR